MTPLRQRYIEDMLLRGLAPTTQRSYIHYVADFAKYYNLSPDKLDLEAVRQYQLYLLNEKKLSPKSVNAFVAAVQFFYQVTVEMPWGKESFSRVREGRTLPSAPHIFPRKADENFYIHVPKKYIFIPAISLSRLTLAPIPEAIPTSQHPDFPALGASLLPRLPL